MNNPPVALRDYLAANVAGLTAFVGQLRASGGVVPRNAAFLSGETGPNPTRVMGEPEEVLTAVVAITLRWSSYSGGDAMIRSIRDAIQAASIAGFLDVFAVDSEPIPLAQTDDGDHLFLLTVEMTHIQVAA